MEPTPPSDPEADTDETGDTHSTAQANRSLALLLVVLLFLLLVTVGTFVQGLSAGFGLWFTEIFIFLGVTWVFLRISGRDPLGYPRAASPGWGAVALGFLAGVVNYGTVAAPLQVLSHYLAPPELRQIFDATRLFKDQTTFELFLILSAVSVAAPVCEEYFFRGVFQQGLMPPGGRAARAILLTSVIFSFFHLDPIGFLARVELGALFGYLFLRTGSLWPSVAAHAANNIVTSALYFYFVVFRGVTEDPNEVPDFRALALNMLVGVPIVLVLLRAAGKVAHAPARPAFASGPPPSFLRAAAPWFAGGIASLALLCAVDARGVVLNFFDQWIAPISPRAELSLEEKERREALDALRKAARRGEVPLDKYFQERRQLARGLEAPGQSNL